MRSRSSGGSGSSICSDRGSAVKANLVVWWGGNYSAFCQTGAEGTLTDNRCTVNKPVTILSLALVRADGAGVNHCNRIVAIKGDGRVGGSQGEVRGVRNLCKIVQS